MGKSCFVPCCSTGYKPCREEIACFDRTAVPCTGSAFCTNGDDSETALAAADPKYSFSLRFVLCEIQPRTYSSAAGTL